MRLIRLLACIGCIVILATPTAAFSADSLSIVIDETGGAIITFSYSLTWFEDVVVFLQIANPSQELKAALERYSGESVEVVGVTGRSASFTVKTYASIAEDNGVMVYTTPELHLEDANKLLQTYWFAPLVNVDVSPNVTTIVFSDGYTETFTDVVVLPSITHPQIASSQQGGCGCST